jgi:hypothetical protein
MCWLLLLWLLLLAGLQQVAHKAPCPCVSLADEVCHLHICGHVRALQGCEGLLPLPGVVWGQQQLLAGQQLHLHLAILVWPMPQGPAAVGQV